MDGVCFFMTAWSLTSLSLHLQYVQLPVPTPGVLLETHFAFHLAEDPATNKKINAMYRGTVAIRFMDRNFTLTN